MSRISSPGLQESTRSSSRVTQTLRGILPRDRLETCSWILTSYNIQVYAFHNLNLNFRGVNYIISRKKSPQPPPPLLKFIFTPQKLGGHLIQGFSIKLKLWALKKQKE